MFAGRFAREKVFSTTRNIVAVFTEETDDKVVEMRVARAANRQLRFSSDQTISSFFIQPPEIHRLCADAERITGPGMIDHAEF